jgi:diketogulonate reductase-like aldo/keto reductase
LRWIYQQGIPLTTKASSAEHLAEDIDIFSWSLTDEEMATLSAATSPAGSPSLMMKCSSKTFKDEMEGFLSRVEE